jgi:hypothetical protein
MSDRTPEQVKADEELDEAIRKASRAYGYDGLITTWVVAASYAVAYEDGEGSGVGLFFPRGVCPWAAAIGTVRMASLKLERDFLAE